MVAKVGAGRADLTGQRFGRLVCIEAKSEVMPTGRRQVYWRCLCDCGNETWVRPQPLKENRIVSCGCKQKDNSKFKSENSWCLVPEYSILSDIKRRCNPESKHSSVKNYGARGIEVCAEWSIPGKVGLDNFLNDMGPRPSPLHSIERKDVNGNYCKENCIWTDDDGLQAFNQRPRKSKYGIPGIRDDGQGYGYVVTIGKDGVRHYVGYFTSLLEAAKARKQAELDYYGFNLDWELPEDE